MRSIRKFAYAAVLGLSLFSLQPTLVSAEEARGAFTLSHDVTCQNHVLRAGSYTFSVTSVVRPAILVLHGVNRTGGDAMLLANDVETSTTEQPGSLTLVSRGGQSFISAMELPGSDITLHFAVPRERKLK